MGALTHGGGGSLGTEPPLPLLSPAPAGWGGSPSPPQHAAWCRDVPAPAPRPPATHLLLLLQLHKGVGRGSLGAPLRPPLHRGWGTKGPAIAGPPLPPPWQRPPHPPLATSHCHGATACHRSLSPRPPVQCHPQSPRPRAVPGLPPSVHLPVPCPSSICPSVPPPPQRGGGGGTAGTDPRVGPVGLVPHGHPHQVPPWRAQGVAGHPMAIPVGCHHSDHEGLGGRPVTIPTGCHRSDHHKSGFLPHGRPRWVPPWLPQGGGWSTRDHPHRLAPW